MLLVNYIDYLGIYIDSELIAPIFNKEIVEAFIPLLIASAVFTICASILKVFYAAWDFKFTIFYTASKIFSTVVTVIFINYANLFNTLMFDKIAEFSNLTTAQVSNGFQTGINVFTIFICIAVSFDLIASWFKTLKNHKI